MNRAPAWRRHSLRAGLTFAVLLLGLVASWIAIHRIRWLGPLLADTARSVVGPKAVAKLEDTAYGVEDTWNRSWRADEAPSAYWPVPSAAVDGPPAPCADAGADLAPAWKPASVGPIHAAHVARGDGAWVPLADPKRPSDSPRMFKTLLHPDPARSWSAVAIVAIDTSRTLVSLVPGTKDPKATAGEATGVPRPGLIPRVHHERLIAAFNGGFKTEHGQLGLRVDGVTFIPPNRWGCTFARLHDDSLLIASWPRVRGQLQDMRWLRQAAPCLVEQGEFGAGVKFEGNINWGCSPEGDTIIRRSAVGLDASSRTLFVGIGDATSAGSMATAMRHAGAHTVAQFDVNYAFPRFLVYTPREGAAGEPIADALCPGFQFTKDDWVRVPGPRDFFYGTAR
jgi:hypothetical protein